MRGSFSSLRRLLSDAVASPRGGYRIPEGQRVYTIGDIHGRADLLEELHDTIRDELSAAPEGLAATV